MKRWTIICFFFLTSCDFKFPLYKVTDLIEVPELVGDWEYPDSANENDNTTWTLTKQSEKVYHILYSYHNVQNFYIARFLRLKGQLFMDLQFADNDYKVNAIGHLIAKVSSDSSIFKVTIFNPVYLVDLAKKNKIKLAYETTYDKSSDYNTGSNYTILEPTEKLQKIIIEYMNDKNVFSDKSAMKFKRKTK